MSLGVIHSAPAQAAPRGSKLRPRGFELLVVVLMALGAVVFFEPAPFDLLIVLLLPIALLLRKLAIPRHSAVALIAVGLFIVANVISLVPARDTAVALRFAAITAYLIMAWVFVLGLSGKYGERATQIVMLGWTWGAVVTAAISILSYFGILPFADQLAIQGRMNGTFKDANVYGAYLVAPSVWAVSRLVLLERGRRLSWAIALIVCGTAILLTYSRGAWISLGVAMSCFFGLRMVGYNTARARIMTLLAVPVAVVLLAFALDRLADVGMVQDMLSHRVGPQAYDVDRFATQREALEIAAREPLGIGPGQSESAFTRAAHNTYVRGFAENGYLGGGSLILLMFSSMLAAIWVAIGTREPRRQIAMAVVASALAAICVESLVIDAVHWRHLWILMGLAWTPAIGRENRGSMPA